MLVLLAFLALASANINFTIGSGESSTSYWAGNFNNVSFFGNPSTYSQTDGTAHQSGLVIPSATVDATLEPEQIPLNITKSILGNFLDNNWFYNFPFAPGTSCVSTTCPDQGANAISTPAGGSPHALAGFFQNLDALYFDFSEKIGAFGISFALRTTDAAHPTTPQLEFSFGFDETITHRAVVTPNVGGEMTRVFFEPTVSPLHSRTINNITVRFMLADVDSFGNAFDPIDGAWFVFNEVIYGQTGYNCSDPLNTASLTINLEELPEATAISYDGDSSENPSQGPWIPNVGNQKVILCVPPGTPAISVEDNGYIFRSYVDGNNEPIVCGSGHFSSFATRCALDPRAILNLPVPCVPELSTVNFTISLWESSTEFRSELPVEMNPTYTVLASQFVYATMKGDTRHTPAGSSYTCRKGNSQQSPGTCVATNNRGTISKAMEFRAKCADAPVPEIPNPIDVTVYIEDGSSNLSWLLEDKENTDFELCVPAFGTFKYFSEERGVNNVTSDVATTSCSSASSSTRCNTTPLDLVTILQGPQTCGEIPSCDGGYWNQRFVGGNQSLGFPTSLSYNGVLFRNFWQQPFQAMRYCVMNLNTVELSTKINTVDNPLMTSLSAEYDCTRTEGATPGVCAAEAGNPTNFFTNLNVDSLKLPTGISFKIDYFEKSIEDDQIVCSCGTLADSVFCNQGDKYQKICIPALGSDKVSRECENDYQPSGIKVVAQECAGDLCFPSSNDTCRPEQEECITSEMRLDCRDECTATLGKEFCLWDMKALPTNSQTVELLAKNTNYDSAVRSVSGLGGKPEYLTVLAAEFRTRIIETNTVYQVESGELDCQFEACKWNDYLSILKVDEALLYNGEQVLNNIDVEILGTSRPWYNTGKDQRTCPKKIAVLADPNNSYSVRYRWMGQFYRNVTGITCEACPSQYCSAIPPLVRWAAIDPTVPTQEEYHIVIDGVGQVIEQDNQNEFKSYGNPWAGNPLELVVGGVSLPYNAYGGTICYPVDNQQNYMTYYLLATDDGNYNDVQIKVGCDSEDYQLECPVGSPSSDQATCGSACPLPATPATYYRACVWKSNYTVPENLGPDQRTNCSSANCAAAWNAIQPFVNNVVDLRCLPDGSSDIPSTLPTSPFNQNMYRGQNYTNYMGILTSRQNPINLELCCGGDCQYISGKLQNMGPPGSSCASPIVLEEAGGFQNVFTGLFHFNPTPYTIKVQELFRTEAQEYWESVRPMEHIDACADMSLISAEWQARIRASRPTACINDLVPAATSCGPSTPDRVCGYVYAQDQFVSTLQKGEANNQVQLKFTYGLQFQMTPNSVQANVTAWNVDRPHTLLRPNKYAALADSFCVIRDETYLMRVFDDLVPTGSEAINCTTTPCVDSNGQTVIPLQGIFGKKK